MQEFFSRSFFDRSVKIQSDNEDRTRQSLLIAIAVIVLASILLVLPDIDQSPRLLLVGCLLTACGMASKRAGKSHIVEVKHDDHEMDFVGNLALVYYVLFSVASTMLAGRILEVVLSLL